MFETMFVELKASSIKLCLGSGKNLSMQRINWNGYNRKSVAPSHSAPRSGRNVKTYDRVVALWRWRGHDVTSSWIPCRLVVDPLLRATRENWSFDLELGRCVVLLRIALRFRPLNTSPSSKSIYGFRATRASQFSGRCVTRKLRFGLFTN